MVPLRKKALKYGTPKLSILHPGRPLDSKLLLCPHTPNTPKSQTRKPQIAGITLNTKYISPVPLNPKTPSLKS